MQEVVEASWVSLRSLPPKEAIVAVVLKAIVAVVPLDRLESRGSKRGGECEHVENSIRHKDITI